MQSISVTSAAMDMGSSRTVLPALSSLHMPSDARLLGLCLAAAVHQVLHVRSTDARR
jgi:hypothetical protein